MLFGEICEGRSRAKMVTLRLTSAEYAALKEAAWAAKTSMNLFALTAIGREIARQTAAGAPAPTQERGT